MSAGGTVLLDAESNIAIISSDLKGQDIGLKAFDEILIASGEESRIRESRSQSGGFLSGGSLYSSVEQMTGTAHITANSSAVHANGNLVIDAGSATVIGSKVSADGILQVSTDVGDIRVLAAEERTETVSYEQRIKLGLDALTNAITRPDKLINTDNGQVSISLGKAEYEENEFKSTSVTHKGSELDGKRGVVLDAAGDALIEGSSVNSDEGTIYVKAGGDITVRDVIDRYEEQSKSVQGSAEISVVVQHQAVEVAKAAMAVDDAKDLVKQAEADYRKYKKERDALEDTLAKLEQDYQNKVPGVTYSDINELKALLGDIKDDEAWYLAGIASATANLVSKTTLLIQQTAAAAQSSATYGFNAGLQLAITGSESQSQTTATTSQGSNITGQNILLMTGEEGKTGNITIQGSVVEADEALAIATNTLNVLAGQSTLQSQNSQQQASIVISQTVWGAAGGPSVNASYSNSQNRDQQTTHTNSSLSGDRVTIITEGDANIIGGNIHGDTGVAMTIGGDLRLESVQDRASGSSQGFGISGGMSFGGDFTNKNGAAANSKEAKTTSIGGTNGVAGVNGGLNASSGRYQSSETVLSSITGSEVDINVTGHTELIGALIAARDEDGNDTGKLTFSTDSLNIEHLSNRSYSSNQSAGVSANVAVSSQANAGNPTQSSTDLALNSSNYSYQNNSSQSLDKTLTTIGQGSLNVGGEAVNPEGLNRDISNLTKEIYDVDRQQGNIELTVDHRLLSEDGRKQIAEDAKRTEILGSSIKDLVEQSVSLTGSGEGVDSLRDHIGNKQDYFTATKNFTRNPENAEHIATLGNNHATPEQVQAAYTALANSIAQQMGVSPTEALVLMQNDPQFAGAHSRDTNLLYINDQAHDSAGKAVNTVGHETQHYLDNQQNPNASQSTEYKANRENYAEIMGNATEDYLKFNFAQNDYSLADNKSHSMGSTLEDKQRNLNLILTNRAQLQKENPDSLDYCGPACIRLSATNPALLNTTPAVSTPGRPGEDNLDANALAAAGLQKDINKLAGFLGGVFSGEGQPELTESEVFGKTLDTFEIFDMLKVGQAYQMPDGSILIKRGAANVTLEMPGTNISDKYSMVTAEELGRQGGFIPEYDPITALPNPGIPPTGQEKYENIPVVVENNTGGYQAGENSSSNTATPIHEGHWSDNLVFNENGESTLNQKHESAIRRIDNLINNALKDHDITGTLKDMDGNPVPKNGGGYWDHLQEMQNTLRGLRNHAETLKGVNNDMARDSYQKALDAINKIEDAIKGHGI